MNTYYDEIYEQPAVLRAALAAYQAQRPELLAWLMERLQDVTRVIFTGMGTSFIATYPAVLHLRQRGVETLAIDTAELLHYQSAMLDPETLVVGISQSGKSVELLKVLADLADDVPLVGITNTADSPLAERADITLTMQAGPERAASTKTYLATLAVLELLACDFNGECFDDAAATVNEAADRAAAALDGWRSQVAQRTAEIADSQFFVYLGRGPSLASAQSSALIAKESAKVPTEGTNTAYFRHGPIEIVDERISIMMFSGAAPTRALNHRMAAELATKGGQVTVIGPSAAGLPASVAHIPIAPVPDRALPLVEVIPMQFLAGILAEHQGYEAGTFRYIGKVTTDE